MTIVLVLFKNAPQYVPGVPMTCRPNEEKIEKRLEQKQEERSKEDSGATSQAL